MSLINVTDKTCKKQQKNTDASIMNVKARQEQVTHVPENFIRIVKIHCLQQFSCTVVFPFKGCRLCALGCAFSEKNPVVWYANVTKIVKNISFFQNILAFLREMI